MSSTGDADGDEQGGEGKEGKEGKEEEENLPVAVEAADDGGSGNFAVGIVQVRLCV
jgi:hypothetical protein